MRVSLQPLMSSKRDTWNTPSAVLQRVFQLGPVGLDPCSNNSSIVGPNIAWEQAGLELPWSGYGLVYVNPPYGRAIKLWTAKMRYEALINNVEIVALLPCRTDTKWFQEDVYTAQKLCLWKGRLHFGDGPNPAPFPSVVAYWGSRGDLFADSFASAGIIVSP